MTQELSSFWIQAYNGQAIDLVNPTVEMIQPDIIAHALAKIHRYGGHTQDINKFYSVAQHSVHVCQFVDSAELKIPALMHDAAEALWGFCDILYPAKQMMPKAVLEWFMDHESKFNQLIAERFNFDPLAFYHKEIQEADLKALATERRDLMAPLLEPEMQWIAMPEPDPLEIVPLQPPSAKALFLSQYDLWK